MFQQMHIARAEEMLYYSWWRGEGVQLRIKLDQDFWFGTALPTIQEFWRRVQANDWPEPNGETLYEDDKELRQAAVDWFQARKLIETGQYCERIAEAVFKRHAGEARNLINSGVQCQQQVWRPKYMVQIEVDNPTAQASVLKACESLQNRVGAKVKTITWEPKVVHKFTEIVE
jgi:hypothetical protein